MTPPNRYDDKETRQMGVDEIVELTEADRQRTVRASPRGRAEAETNPDQLFGEPERTVRAELQQLREQVGGGFAGVHTRIDNFRQEVTAAIASAVAPVKRRQDKQGRWVAVAVTLGVVAISWLLMLTAWWLWGRN